MDTERGKMKPTWWWFFVLVLFLLVGCEADAPIRGTVVDKQIVVRGNAGDLVVVLTIDGRNQAFQALNSPLYTLMQVGDTCDIVTTGTPPQVVFIKQATCWRVKPQ